MGNAIGLGNQRNLCKTQVKSWRYCVVSKVTSLEQVLQKTKNLPLSQHASKRDNTSTFYPVEELYTSLKNWLLSKNENTTPQGSQDPRYTTKIYALFIGIYAT